MATACNVSGNVHALGASRLRWRAQHSAAVGVQPPRCMPSSRDASSSPCSKGISLLRRKTTIQRRLAAAAASSDDSKAYDDTELVQSGAIVSAHGLRGEVRVMPFTDFVEERFFSPCTQFMENEAQGRTRTGDYDKPPGTVTKIKIVSGREVTSKGRNECIVKLKGVNDRNASEALIGRRLYVLISDRPQLREEDHVGDGDDEFYAQELEGLQVILQATGEVVGEVIDVYRGAGQHDLLKVSVPPVELTEEQKGEESEGEVSEKEGEGEVPKKKKNRGPGEHVFIPFVKDIVPVVDMKRRVLEIPPPAGLLDLRQRTMKPKRAKQRGPPPPKKTTT
mmetsp:Transcript_38704/g.96017  ORF Transcript_38704/g.96017 Transcript_38704/m.96017 type:complete len:336 (+) Transcript_38704:269-1276(+)